ncbi:hypothetical protein D3C77_717590 [compost metagenome]
MASAMDSIRGARPIKAKNAKLRSNTSLAQPRTPAAGRLLSWMAGRPRNSPMRWPSNWIDITSGIQRISTRSLRR